jgi:hypothetical protein
MKSVNFVRAAYNRAEYLAEHRMMVNRWADWIETSIRVRRLFQSGVRRDSSCSLSHRAHVIGDRWKQGGVVICSKSAPVLISVREERGAYSAAIY